MATIDGQLEQMQAQARRQGKVEPTELPPAIQQERVEAEARFDIICKEIAMVRGKLAELEAREEKAKDSEVLKYGPCGTSKGDPVRMIDFQPVVPDSEGVLRISCPRSPYNKMKVSD
ncbi:MAG: hypothetical protein KJ822_17580 [Proteobacteria bacterium]|nr:hypothetical protein [Pseudomonadota bacterium]